MSAVTVPQALTLALQHHRAGRLVEAEALYRQILGAQPDHAEALHHLGIIAQQKGRPDLAVNWIRRALALDPHNAAAHSNLGEGYRTLKRFDEAIASFRRALEIKPDDAKAQHNLANVLAERGQLDEAVTAFRQALQLQPDLAEAHNNLGNALAAQGRREDAINSYRRALDIRPDYPEAHYHLAAALVEQGCFAEAAEAYRRIIQLRPNRPEIYNALGNTLARAGRIDEAESAYLQALALQPDYAEACVNLGNALVFQGRLDEVFAAYRRALQLRPDDAALRSCLIFLLPFSPATDSNAVQEEQARWNRLLVAPLRPGWRRHGNNTDPLRRLKIGYVSPDFCSHPVAFFLAPLLESHDRELFEIHCYASVPHPDAVTERLRKSAEVWRDVSGLSDTQLAEQVRADGIDILIDLTMHATGNRLPAFARRPAPVQVSWLAYAGSTGMEAIDYRLSDARLDPLDEMAGGPGGEVVRLPDSWCCYLPIEEFPLVGELPAVRKGGVTFGSLNQFAKIHEGLLHCWARLLERVPKSRLLMVCPEGRARDRTRAVFARHGVAAERLEWAAPGPWVDYVRLFARIDVALDSSPCNGMTTTCHALWMGLPVVTLAGWSALSRAGRSLLHTIGLPELIAESEEEYVQIAAQWATDLSRTAELRATLRSRMQASPLMDAPRFGRHVETAYSAMWQRWCGDATTARS